MRDLLILFPMEHEFRKLFFMTFDLKVWEELELLTNIPDFTTLYPMMLRCKYSI